MRVTLSVAGMAIVATCLTARAECGDPGGFQSWLSNVGREAVAEGIPARVVDEGLGGLTFDPEVVRRDHSQGVFRQDFDRFSRRMVSPARLAKAKSLEARYADVFRAIERKYGVSPPVLLAIWGLETDFGASNGNFRTIRSIATLAYDCRRSDMFRTELFDALRMVQRGSISTSSRGAWAGEIGQTQFMPSTYMKYAVSYRGGGNPDLNRDPADVLASTANFLQANGWQRGAGWAPGEPNFAAIQEWNKAAVYSRTIAYFASRIAGEGVGASDAGDADRVPASRRREPDRGYLGEGDDYGAARSPPSGNVDDGMGTDDPYERLDRRLR